MEDSKIKMNKVIRKNLRVRLGGFYSIKIYLKKIYFIFLNRSLIIIFFNYLIVHFFKKILLFFLMKNFLRKNKI